MTATTNMRRTLVSVAEHALRCWNVSTRERATALLPQWPFVDGLDDDMRAEVLDRFPLDEPLMVAGKDFLAPAEFSPREYRDKDGDLWLEYQPGVVKCIQRSGVRTIAHAWPVQLDSARIAYGPLVEVVSQPAADTVQ